VAYLIKPEYMYMYMTYPIESDQVLADKEYTGQRSGHRHKAAGGHNKQKTEGTYNENRIRLVSSMYTHHLMGMD
jgi:hypothetical protein